MRLQSLLSFVLGAVALFIIIFAAPRPLSTVIQAGAQEQSPTRANGQSVRATSSPEADKADSKATTAPLVVRELDAAAIKELLKRDPRQPRPLLVNFWATWCEPCREEFPDLVRINADYQGRGLEFITISLDDVMDIKTTVPQFLEEKHASMPAYLLNPSDPDALVAVIDPTWGGALPATFLFDARGQIAFRQMGRVKVALLRAALEKVLSEK
ncbi:MAG TPA: TlpA disulfide reductase family protein [Pyrinomonadaceae bacterium]|jgi:thiol-disulfide isomerase/thioredoxin